MQRSFPNMLEAAHSPGCASPLSLTSAPFPPNAASLEGITSVGALLLALVLHGCANSPGVQLASATGVELQREGRQLGAGELRQLVRPGSKVVRRTPEGYVHFWTNEPDGTFVSHTDSSFFWGHGKWLVHDNTYCIRIEWNSKDFGRTVNEAYCYGIYAKGDRFFQGPPTITPASASQSFGEVRFSN